MTPGRKEARRQEEEPEGNEPLMSREPPGETWPGEGERDPDPSGTVRSWQAGCTWFPRSLPHPQLFSDL